jgi:hypothetical protein
MQKMQEQFSAKEKYPKEIRQMPLASCAPSFLSGFARKDIPVFLAKCVVIHHIEAHPIRRVTPRMNDSGCLDIVDLRG